MTVMLDAWGVSEAPEVRARLLELLAVHDPQATAARGDHHTVSAEYSAELKKQVEAALVARVGDVVTAQRQQLAAAMAGGGHPSPSP